MRRLLILIAVCLGSAIGAQAQVPEIVKVEPPGWWVGHSLNPVRLLMRGRNLTGARLSAQGLRIANVKVNQSGSYVFADVTIPGNATPGARPVTVTTAAGQAVAPFELLRPLGRAGRFQGFSQDDIIYLIMPDRFCNGDTANDDPPQSAGLLDRQKPRYYHGGDLRGIIKRLPYLKDMGVTAVWLNPVYDNVNHLNRQETYDGQAITDYHGYGAVDFYAVDEHFGDLAVLRELVDTAHRNGIKIILDHVANHTGPYHPWVQDPPTPTWYNGTAQEHLSNTWQTWTLADPHATEQMQRATLRGWFINILPDLNQDDPETARYIIQNTLWWIGSTGSDGIRQDTLPYVPRRFWRDWTSAIKREYPQFKVVGEVFDGDPSLVSFFQGGRSRFDGVDTGIDALFDFPLYYPIRRAFAQGGTIREAAQMLSRDHLYVNPNNLVTFLGLHDVPRFMNEPGATGEGMKLALTFLLTVRGIPMIYYGDEIGMPGGGDPDNRRDFPGGWPGDARNAFEASGRTPVEQAIFAHLRTVARLRAATEPLRRGALKQLAVGDQTWIFARTFGQSIALVAFNNATNPQHLECEVRSLGLADGITFSDALGVAPAVRVMEGKVTAELPPRSAAIYVISQ